jgi:hypothetical protein
MTEAARETKVATSTAISKADFRNEPIVDNTVGCLRVERVGRRAVDNLDLIDFRITTSSGECGCLSSLIAYEVRDEIPIEGAIQESRP